MHRGDLEADSTPPGKLILLIQLGIFFTEHIDIYCGVDSPLHFDINFFVL